MRPHMLFVFAAIVSTATLPAGCQAAPGEADRVTQFLRSVVESAYRTEYDLSYRDQLDLERMKSKNPKVLWQQLGDEGFRAFHDAKVSLKRVDSYDPYLRGMAVDAAVVELRLRARQEDNIGWRWIDLAYVQLRYADPKRSPIHEYREGLIKSVMLEVRLDSESDLVFKVQPVDGTVELWETVPFRIVSVLYRADTGNYILRYIGGQGPYSATVTCGDFARTSSKPHTSFRREDEPRSTEVTALPPPFECEVTASDASGEHDSVRVRDRREDRRAWRFYARNPWYRAGQLGAVFHRNPVMFPDLTQLPWISPLEEPTGES